MQYEPLDMDIMKSAGAFSGTTRTGELAEFLQAKAIEEGVRKKLSNLDKGALLRSLLIILPIIATLISLAGGLYTVYSSTDCKDSKFAKYSRIFLYTSISYTLTNLVMDKTITAIVLPLMRHPSIAFATYCLQATIVAGFVITMGTLLILVYRSACPSVKSKVLDRLK